MKYLFKTLALLSFVFAFQAGAVCSQQSVMGASYQQAKYNCEVMLNGQATDIRLGLNTIWYGSCFTGCNNPGGGAHYQRVIGAGYSQARYNCEMMLNGRVDNCQPGPNNLWYCGCTY